MASGTEMPRLAALDGGGVHGGWAQSFFAAIALARPCHDSQRQPLGGCSIVPVEEELSVSDEVCFTKENRDDERQQAPRAGSGGRQQGNPRGI